MRRSQEPVRLTLINERPSSGVVLLFDFDWILEMYLGNRRRVWTTPQARISHSVSSHSSRPLSSPVPSPDFRLQIRYQNLHSPDLCCACKLLSAPSASARRVLHESSPRSCCTQTIRHMSYERRRESARTMQWVAELSSLASSVASSPVPLPCSTRPCPLPQPSSLHRLPGRPAGDITDRTRWPGSARRGWRA